MPTRANTALLEAQFPLVVAGTEPLRGLDDSPGVPVAMRGFEAEWSAMQLSKRRLALYGSPEQGHLPTIKCASILGAECRARDVPLTAAEQLAAEMPVESSSEPERRIRRQLPKAVRWGYSPPNGTPLLTGCCRDPRRTQMRPEKTPLRALLAPYCDGACAASCPILRAIRFPKLALGESEYARMDESDLWVHGGLGHAAHVVWRELALLALATPDKVVASTASYIVQRAGSVYSLRQVQKMLKALAENQLAPILGRSGPLTTRLVPVLNGEELAALERRRGVFGQRQRNLREARAQTEDYHRLRLAQLTDLEKLTAWGGR